MLNGITNIGRQIADTIRLFQGSEGRRTGISDVVQPVIQVKDTGITQVLYEHQTVGATGLENFFTVPDNEFWTLHYLHAYVSSGTWTMGGVKVSSPDTQKWDMNASPRDPDKWTIAATQNQWLYWVSAGGANPLVLDCSTNCLPFRFPPAWKCDINVDAYTGTGSMLIFGVVTREIYK